MDKMDKLEQVRIKLHHAVGRRMLSVIYQQLQQRPRQFLAAVHLLDLDCPTSFDLQEMPQRLTRCQTPTGVCWHGSWAGGRS